jgi:hypothetical protein
MTDNLAIWNALERTDPKHVKAITGKAYQGNSPRPHWVIWKLTEQFGPVGVGFGWTVLHDAYVPGVPRVDGVEQMHEVRISFWAGSGKPVESYGATKALYKAKVNADGTGGYWVSDEDAAKKSLTDAITKAASWLGVAGDIFMGRWDDSKYVEGLKREAARPDLKTASKDLLREQLKGSLEPPHDPETGEIPPKPNSASIGLRTAYEDGIRDALPLNATDRQFFEAAAAQLRADFSDYKSVSGLTGGWSKNEDLLERLQTEAADLFDGLLTHFNACRNAIEAAGPTVKISAAEGHRILGTIGLCSSVGELDDDIATLPVHARVHAKVLGAAEKRRAVLSEPVMAGEHRIA